MQKIKLLILIFFISVEFGLAQSNPVLLDTNIHINRIMTVKNGVIRLGIDPVSKNLFYILTTGKIYEVIRPAAGAAFDSLVDSSANHHVMYVQGMRFFDSTLYVSGNNYSDSSLTIGIIARGKLFPDGSRHWDTLMITNGYQTADYFDHLFSGLVVNPAGDTIYISSGARGDHGEIQTRYGKYPGLRNVPLTTNIYALPTHNSATIILPNDSALLASSGYVFCRGVRNHFDMAFDSNGNLFGLENSGDRDHNEEMNWLRKDHHYGFPWRMGDTENPQQFSTFNPATDKLINHFYRTWKLGFWNNDPAFPPPPSGLTFDAPIQNYGPDCDKFRDSTGAVHDASDSSLSIGTFTAHRSPLGLVFDNAHLLDAPYNGDAFMLSWTKGYDSCGCTTVPDTAVGPFVDPSQDLVHLHLTFDSVANNFRLNATRIIGEFQHPVDAAIDSNKIFVVENGYGGTSGIYEITFPLKPIPLACNPALTYFIPDLCKPQINSFSIPSFGLLPNNYVWYNTNGNIMKSDSGMTKADTVTSFPSGDYYVVISDAGACGTDTLSFNVPDSLYFKIDSVSNTTCIGCDNGKIFFSLSGGALPYNIQFSAGLQSGNSFINLPPFNYQMCVSDVNGCTLCDQAAILEDPTFVQAINKNVDYIISPNPVSGTANLYFEGSGKTIIKVLNSNGVLIKILLNEVINPGIHNFTFNCNELANGSYILEISDAKNRTYKKLIVIN